MVKIELEQCFGGGARLKDSTTFHDPDPVLIPGKRVNDVIHTSSIVYERLKRNRSLLI